MIAIQLRSTLVLLAALLAKLPASAQAQAAAPKVPVADSTDSVPHKKHGGLFGKAKSLAGSKVVKSVAKVAACTMVPGGQAIAGAIDASNAKNAGEAAQGAAAAASGTSCMPGMGANMAAAGMSRAGMTGAGLAGVGVTNAAAMAAAASARSGAAQGMMPYGGTPGVEQMAAESEPGERALAECYGISSEEFVALTRPTGMEQRQPTKAEMKRQAQIGKKVGSQKMYDCNRSVGMQQGAAEMSAVSQTMAGAETKMAQAQAQTAAGTMTEAPGLLPVLADDPAAELTKGKTALRQVDWIAGGTDVSAAARPAFQEALGKLGQAMRQTGGRYRIDVYMMQRYDETAARMYGPGRLATIQQLLGSDGFAVEPGKVKRDKDPRIEIVRLK
jgi:hypothetical protein